MEQMQVKALALAVPLEANLAAVLSASKYRWNSFHLKIQNPQCSKIEQFLNTDMKQIPQPTSCNVL